MFTDIAAYTALMGEDEQRARQVLERSRALLGRLVSAQCRLRLHTAYTPFEVNFGAGARSPVVSPSAFCRGRLRASRPAPQVKRQRVRPPGSTVMRTSDLEGIANEVKTAQDLGKQIELLSARVSGFDNAAAYEVARLIHLARMREGALPVGRKIGFTNRDMWWAYGVCEPIWAFVYDTTVVHLAGSRGTRRIGRFTEPCIEAEVVLHFRSAPPLSEEPADVLACIDWVAHGIEIVQSHFRGWKFQAADTIADWALHGTLLVGEPQSVDRIGADIVSRLEWFTIALSCDGDVRDVGRGSNVLGSPLAAAAHLVGVLAKQPEAKALEADELVTTGT